MGGFHIGRRKFLIAAGFAAALPITRAQAAGKRIVCAGGAMTEIVFALGHGDDVVAVDTTSWFPYERVSKLPKIGYLRMLAAEGVLSTQPDLILADHDAGPPDVILQLQSMKINLHQFPDKPTAETVGAKINFVGNALGEVDKAREISTAYDTDLLTLQGAVEKLPVRPSVLFLLNAASNGLRGAGAGTGADDIIRLAGGSNAFGGAKGYQSVSPESALTADPAFILLMKETLDEMGGIEQVKALPALAHLKAVAEGRIIAMHGSYLLGFGPRTAHATRELAAQLHPHETLPALPPRRWLGI
jgi:iron complex transport system substrate-binding protein